MTDDILGDIMGGGEYEEEVDYDDANDLIVPERSAPRTEIQRVEVGDFQRQYQGEEENQMSGRVMEESIADNAPVPSGPRALAFSQRRHDNRTDRGPQDFYKEREYRAREIRSLQQSPSIAKELPLRPLQSPRESDRIPRDALPFRREYHDSRDLVRNDQRRTSSSATSPNFQPPRFDSFHSLPSNTQVAPFRQRSSFETRNDNPGRMPLWRDGRQDDIHDANRNRDRDREQRDRDRERQQIEHDRERDMEREEKEREQGERERERDRELREHERPREREQEQGRPREREQERYIDIRSGGPTYRRVFHEKRGGGPPSPLHESYRVSPMETRGINSASRLPFRDSSHQSPPRTRLDKPPISSSINSSQPSYLIASSAPRFLTRIPPLPPNPEIPRFFNVKTSNFENIRLAQELDVWACGVRAAPILKEAFRLGKVYLVFSVVASRHFQGYAEMMTDFGGVNSPQWYISDSKPRYSDSFGIKWFRKCNLSFEKCTHLRNRLSENIPVKTGYDGEEIDRDTGMTLCDMMDQLPEELAIDTTSNRDAPEPSGYSPRQERQGRDLGGTQGRHFYTNGLKRAASPVQLENELLTKKMTGESGPSSRHGDGTNFISLGQRPRWMGEDHISEEVPNDSSSLVPREERKEGTEYHRKVRRFDTSDTRPPPGDDRFRNGKTDTWVRRPNFGDDRFRNGKTDTWVVRSNTSDDNNRNVRWDSSDSKLPPWSSRQFVSKDSRQDVSTVDKINVNMSDVKGDFRQMPSSRNDNRFDNENRNSSFNQGFSIRGLGERAKKENENTMMPDKRSLAQRLSQPGIISPNESSYGMDSFKGQRRWQSRQDESQHSYSHGNDSGNRDGHRFVRR